MTPSKEGDFAEYEAFGVEDPRINPLEGAYYITYSAYSKHGVRIGLAKTTDFIRQLNGLPLLRRPITAIR